MGTEGKVEANGYAMRQHWLLLRFVLWLLTWRRACEPELIAPNSFAHVHLQRDVMKSAVRGCLCTCPRRHAEQQKQPISRERQGVGDHTCVKSEKSSAFILERIRVEAVLSRSSILDTLRL